MEKSGALSTLTLICSPETLFHLTRVTTGILQPECFKEINLMLCNGATGILMFNFDKESVADPGCLSRIRIQPFFLSPIPDLDPTYYKEGGGLHAVEGSSVSLFLKGKTLRYIDFINLN
jgi:hypothetical protein